MVFSVRINGTLAQEIGTTRLHITVDSPATMNDVIQKLIEQYPQSAKTLQIAIPFVAGQHLGQTTTLKQGDQIALLMPAAGG